MIIMSINEWIDKRLSELLTKCPRVIPTEAEMFVGGYNVGYKKCLEDFKKMLLDENEE